MTTAYYSYSCYVTSLCVASNAAYCYRSSVVSKSVCLSVYVSVCLLVTTVSPAEKVEPIEVPLDLDLWS